MSQSSPETMMAIEQLLFDRVSRNRIAGFTVETAQEIMALIGHAQGPLIEALEFYANPTRYSGPNRRIDGDPDKYQPEGLYYQLDVTRDGGRIARRALSSVTSTVRDGADEPQEGQS